MSSALIYFSKSFLSSVLLSRASVSLQLNRAAKELRRKNIIPLVPISKLDWLELLQHDWHWDRNLNHNYKHAEIKVKWHTSPFMFYLHNLESKNMRAVVSEASSVQRIIPHPCHDCGHFLLSQWFRGSIIRSPMMENRDSFISPYIVWVSTASPPAWGIKGEDGTPEGLAGSKNTTEKEICCQQGTSVYRRHVGKRHMVAFF